MAADKSKDPWDKADIVGKLLSGVVLAVIAFVIKTGADNIAAAQRRGELLRSLITDLTTRERPRQDLALIALNHSVGDDYPELIVQVAERLVIDTTVYSIGDRAANQALSSVALQILQQRDPARGKIAFQILQQRDSARADSLKAQEERKFEVAASADSSTRAALRSAPDTGNRAVLPQSDSMVRAIKNLIAPLSSRVVYIQFQGAVQRQVIEELRTRFDRSGFAAPGTERIATPFSSSIRYFHAEDAALADSVAAIARGFVRDKNLGVANLPVQNLSNRRARVPRGQIEVWVSVR